MKKIMLWFTLGLVLTNNISVAKSIDKTELQAAREHVIHQYILDLGKGDVQAITSLFTENGTVISTSQGLISAEQFFNNFLPKIDNATTIFHQLFISQQNKDRYAARFNFSFILKDGETGSGEYVDEFVFASNSQQLSQVAMFENLKF